MTDAPERSFGTLTVRIDRQLCVGFGDCMEQAPEIFEFDGDGIVRFRGDAPEIERERLMIACDVCPVDALSVTDADGNRLVG